MPKTGSPGAGSLPVCSADMTAAPAVSAVLGDVLWCLGLGCLLGALRSSASMLTGNGPLRCFCWDLLTFVAAAVLVCGFSAGVSASGLTRWYMAAAMLVGTLAWNQAIAPSVYQAASKILQIAVWPLRQLEGKILYPLIQHIQNALHSLRLCRPRKNVRKKPKIRKKQLQKASKVLYN